MGHLKGGESSVSARRAAAAQPGAVGEGRRWQALEGVKGSESQTSSHDINPTIDINPRCVSSQRPHGNYLFLQ